MAAQGPVKVQLVGSLESDISTKISLFLKGDEIHSGILNNPIFYFDNKQTLIVNYDRIQLKILDQERDIDRMRGVYSRAMPKPDVYAICIPLKEETGFSVALQLLKEITESSGQKARIEEKEIGIVLIGVNEYPGDSDPKRHVISEERIINLAKNFETEKLPVKTVFLNAKINKEDEEKERKKIFEAMYNSKYSDDLKKESVSNVQNTRSFFAPLREFLSAEKKEKKLHFLTEEEQERQQKREEQIRAYPIRFLKDDFDCKRIAKEYYDLPQEEEFDEQRANIQRELRKSILQFGQTNGVDFTGRERTLTAELLQYLQPLDLKLRENQQKNKPK